MEGFLPLAESVRVLALFLVGFEGEEGQGSAGISLGIEFMQQ